MRQSGNELEEKDGIATPSWGQAPPPKTCRRKTEPSFFVVRLCTPTWGPAAQASKGVGERSQHQRASSRDGWDGKREGGNCGRSQVMEEGGL